MSNIEEFLNQDIKLQKELENNFKFIKGNDESFISNDKFKIIRSKKNPYRNETDLS